MIDTKLIFADARSHVAWQARAVPDKLLRQVYAVAKMGPTSANCCPMRIVFVTSEEAKARLKPCLFDGNVVKTMNAPVTAIIAYDTQFDDLLPQLYPARDMRTGFASNAQLAATTAFRNSSLQGSSLQGGYLIIAARARARARALDCGPMSGFDNTKTDAEFFPEERWKSNFLCNLGYGEASKLHPRNSRQEYNPMLSVEQCSLPDNSRLSSYSKEGSYADGYTTEILGRVTLADFVTAFYTTVIFKIERTILHWALAKPATDVEVKQLAEGARDTFSAWSIEGRQENQILLSDLIGRTKSWLMVTPQLVGDRPVTRLYFGSAVVPVRNLASGKASLGRGFGTLLGFHNIYSKILLCAARSRLGRRDQ